MTHTLAIAAREVREHRKVLVAALAFGLLPLVMPLLFPTLNHDETRGVFVLIALTCFLLAAAVLGGGSTLAGALAQQRLGFYFSRPTSGLSIWAGKLAGTVALGVLAMPLIALPTLLAGGGIPGYEWPVFAAFLGVSFLLLVALSHAAGIALRSRSNWLVADFLAPAALGWIAWQASRPVRAGLADRGAIYILGALGAILFVAIVAAGALAVVRGRTDIRRAHAVLSKSLWGVASAAVLAYALYMGWAGRAGPADLRGLVAVQPAPGGNLAVVWGEARGFLHTSFLVDLAPDPLSDRRYLPASGRVAFSADGATAAWLDFAGQDGASESRVIWARSGAGALERHETRILFPAAAWPRLFLSSEGSHITVLHGGAILSVFDLATERALVEARLDGAGEAGSRRGFRVLAAALVAPERLRFWSTSSFDTRGNKLTIREVDLRERKVVEVGATAEPYFLLRISADGSSALASVTNSLGKRLDLLDGATGAVLWHGLEDSPGGELVARFLSDGRAMVARVRNREATLTLLSPTGEPLASTAIGAASSLRLGGELASGRMAVGVLAEPGSGPGVPGQTLVVDLATLATVHQLDDLLPLTSWAGEAAAPAGSVGAAARLFRAPNAEIFVVDPGTWERRRVLPTRS